MFNLFAALRFLTRLPVPAAGPDSPVQFGAFWFPAIGGLLALAIAATMHGLQPYLPVSICAAIAVLVWVLLTGALHLDGFADCCDGFAYAGPAENRLAIMRDPANGTYATVGVALLLLLKVVSLQAIATLHSFGWKFGLLALVLAVPRYFVLPLARLLPVAAGSQYANVFKQSLRAPAVGLASLWLVLAGWNMPYPALVATATGVAACAITASLAWQRIGGISGDVLGATIEIGEACGLVAINILLHRMHHG